MTQKLRAPFRYWGSKVRMAPWIVEHLPAHDHFVEACAGSAAVMAVKPPIAAETLNDTDGEIVNFFSVLRDPEMAERLVDWVAFTPYSFSEFRRCFDAIDFVVDDPVDRAFSFLCRMQMAVVPGRTGWSYGVNGASMKRANKPGRWANMPEQLRLAAQRFERVQVTDWDVLELIKRLDAPGVLIFIDPPYHEESRPRSTGKNSGYVEDEFDHDALLEAIANTEHASFAVTHYPIAKYDTALPAAGDFMSYGNVPNGPGRNQRVERLYLLDRSAA